MSSIQTTIESGGVKEVGHQERGIEAISSRSDGQHSYHTLLMWRMWWGLHRHAIVPPSPHSATWQVQVFACFWGIQNVRTWVFANRHNPANNPSTNLEIHHCTRFSTWRGGVQILNLFPFPNQSALFGGFFICQDLGTSILFLFLPLCWVLCFISDSTGFNQY